MNNGLLPNNPAPLPWRGPEQVPLGAAGIITVPHPLNRVPNLVLWVVVNKVAELGFKPGEEFTLTSGGFQTSMTSYAVDIIQTAAISVYARNNPTVNTAITISRWRLVPILF